MSSHPTPPEAPSARKPMSLFRLREMRARGDKISMLTCYDASFARLAEAAEVDCLLVGDSLGMVLQGQSSTVPVTLDEMAYHTRCVARGNQHAWLISDLPFGSYQESKEQALRASAALMQAGAHMVKLEGGGWSAETVNFLTQRGIPVCAHLGLTPQSVFALGGYRVQGRDADGAALLRQHAAELSDAGASMLVLELVPTALAADITQDNPRLITVGIGAGNVTAGQVLVLHDMLGITQGKLPRFVRNFMAGSAGIEEAIRLYVQDVKSGAFPDNAVHGF